jgi:hypothetical protein
MMCTDGVDLGYRCRLCGKPILVCYDYGPSVCWHKNRIDAEKCNAAILARSTTVDDSRPSPTTTTT